MLDDEDYKRIHRHLAALCIDGGNPVRSLKVVRKDPEIIDTVHNYLNKKRRDTGRLSYYDTTIARACGIDNDASSFGLLFNREYLKKNGDRQHNGTESFLANATGTLFPRHGFDEYAEIQCHAQ